MAELREQVGGFRETVDSVIKRQTDQTQQGRLRRSRLGDGSVAQAGDLTFISSTKGNRAMGYIPLGMQGAEQVWAVKSKMFRYAGHAGRLTLISQLENPERLARNWSFKSAMQLINVDTIRMLERPEDLDAAVEWVKSPHLQVNAFEQIAALEPEELARIEPKFVDLAQSQSQMSEDLARLAEQRRRPIPDIFIS